MTDRTLALKIEDRDTWEEAAAEYEVLRAAGWPTVALEVYLPAPANRTIITVVTLASDKALLVARVLGKLLREHGNDLRPVLVEVAQRHSANLNEVLARGQEILQRDAEAAARDAGVIINRAAGFDAPTPVTDDEPTRPMGIINPDGGGWDSRCRD